MRYPIAGLKSSIELSVFTELVELRKLSGVSEISDLADEGIRIWLHTYLKRDEDYLVSLKDISSAVLCAVCINTEDSKPRLRNKWLMFDYRRFMRDQE